ncbi:MAG: LutB/LldF family L-lactate oxidation iron-sulfur protein [Rhodospirillales bacterium]|nr:LutB/LldF family L-lactate oxidation iron-sulfur protein [Rhodospirillales bacterium]MDP6773758.1 LutB/LldF family L-lactate oxidation iron-sulfur protein [Rhodospirillales bacterium]
MESTSRTFEDNARKALIDADLRRALTKLGHGFPVKRRMAVERLPEFEGLRDAARAIKEDVLENLDFYLERFEERVVEQGGQVHWCVDAAEANQAVLAICQEAGARTVTKSKSMIGEEIAINEHLEANGITPVETDLGEYIIQLRGEPPSHIIAPAIHLSMDQVTETFRQCHDGLAADRELSEPRDLLEEARAILRQKFLAADVGITGANMLIAETGSVAVVTNEGNADLTMTLPRVHVVIASLEKVVPTLEDATTILRVLARSATGQETSVYTTFASGPRRPGDSDGPEEFHVVLLDNGRGAMLGGDFHDVLRCIRCGACLNHCPVYGTIGGHAYGWVYSGPIGAVLSPGLIGLEEAGHLPNASTLCGKCEEVCPMRIPLPKMLRHWRTRQFDRDLVPPASRAALKGWAFLAKRPALYRAATGLAMRLLGALGRRRGAFRRMPLAGGWTAARDLPAPEGATFMAQWSRRKGARP